MKGVHGVGVLGRLQVLSTSANKDGEREICVWEFRFKGKLCPQPLERPHRDLAQTLSLHWNKLLQDSSVSIVTKLLDQTHLPCTNDGHKDRCELAHVSAV